MRAPKVSWFHGSLFALLFVGLLLAGCAEGRTSQDQDLDATVDARVRSTLAAVPQARGEASDEGSGQTTRPLAPPPVTAPPRVGRTLILLAASSPTPSREATPTPMPTRTAMPTPTPTPAPTPIPGRPYLYEEIAPPMAPIYVHWRWGPEQESLREIVTDIVIHNDVGDWSVHHGYYLILLQNQISGVGFYLGLQTDSDGHGKAVIFSRWGTRDTSNARSHWLDGWVQSSGHEGDFVGVRRAYDWGAGSYRIRIAPEKPEEDGEWFSLWITDLKSEKATWIGSLKFPLEDGTAKMTPTANATIELYGIPRIRPIDTPQWHVSVKRPVGDGVPAQSGYTRYTYNESPNALLNSDVWYDHDEDAAHLLVGAITERRSPEAELAFD